MSIKRVEKMPESFSFTERGESLRGTILDTVRLQARDLKTRKLKFFDNGDPMMTDVILLQVVEAKTKKKIEDTVSIWVNNSLRLSIQDMLHKNDLPEIGKGDQLFIELVSIDGNNKEYEVVPIT